MSVHLDEQGVIRLEDTCSLDDSERLLQLLLAHPDARIDWRACDGAHAAVVQLLLVARRLVEGPPRDAFLAQYVHPSLPHLQTET